MVCPLTSETAAIGCDSAGVCEGAGVGFGTTAMEVCGDLEATGDLADDAPQCPSGGKRVREWECWAVVHREWWARVDLGGRGTPDRAERGVEGARPRGVFAVGQS